MLLPAQKSIDTAVVSVHCYEGRKEGLLGSPEF